MNGYEMGKYNVSISITSCLRRSVLFCSEEYYCEEFLSFEGLCGLFVNLENLEVKEKLTLILQLRNLESLKKW